MALLTLADLRTHARDAMRDTDANNYAIDTTTLDRLINKAYVSLRGLEDTRPRFLAAITSGLSVSANDRFKAIGASANVRRVLDLYEAATVAAELPDLVLERCEPWEVVTRQTENTTPARPTHYSVTRNGATVGSWLVAFYPQVDATRYYLIRALVEATPLSAVGDKPDCDDQDCYAIADMAAAVGAAIIGLEPDYIASIEKRVPAVHQQALGQMKAELMLKQDVV